MFPELERYRAIPRSVASIARPRAALSAATRQPLMFPELERYRAVPRSVASIAPPRAALSAATRQPLMFPELERYRAVPRSVASIAPPRAALSAATRRYPQCLWIVETFSVDNLRPKNLSPNPVENLSVFPGPLWRRFSYCPKHFSTYSHKLLLLPLLLPKTSDI